MYVNSVVKGQFGKFEVTQTATIHEKKHNCVAEIKNGT